MKGEVGVSKRKVVVSEPSSVLEWKEVVRVKRSRVKGRKISRTLKRHNSIQKKSRPVERLHCVSSLWSHP